MKSASFFWAIYFLSTTFGLRNRYFKCETFFLNFSHFNVLWFQLYISALSDRFISIYLYLQITWLI